MDEDGEDAREAEANRLYAEHERKAGRGFSDAELLHMIADGLLGSGFYSHRIQIKALAKKLTPPFYPYTSSMVREAIRVHYPDARPVEGFDTRLENHILWMLDQLQFMDDAPKAGRWIGWVLAVVERKLGYWDNDESRALVRADVTRTE